MDLVSSHIHVHTCVRVCVCVFDMKQKLHYMVMTHFHVSLISGTNLPCAAKLLELITKNTQKQSSHTTVVAHTTGL